MRVLSPFISRWGVYLMLGSLLSSNAELSDDSSSACAAAASLKYYNKGATISDREKQELKRLMDFAGHAGQETIHDRNLVINAIRARGNRGVRMLVFGCGKDSSFWARTINANGTTVFLEDNAEWANFDRSLNTHVVKYLTAPMGAWQQAIQEGESFAVPRSLYPKLRIEGEPPGFFKSQWDVVLIDAPAGYAEGSPGRMAPIFQAANILARQRRQRPCAPVDVFVHDFNRWVEREWSLMFLTRHARMINYEGLSHSTAMQTRGPNAKYMAWFHAP